jgi:hypothetical protein
MAEKGNASVLRETHARNLWSGGLRETFFRGEPKIGASAVETISFDRARKDFEPGRR